MGNCFFCLARRVTYLLIEKLERNVVLEFGQRELCVRYSENVMAKKFRKGLWLWNFNVVSRCAVHTCLTKNAKESASEQSSE